HEDINRIVVEGLPTPPPDEPQLNDNYIVTPINDPIIDNVVVEDPEVKRKELINKINQFQATFPRIQLNLPKKNWDKLDIDRLENIIIEGEAKLKNENTALLFSAVFFQFTTIVEAGLTRNTSIDLTGYTNQLRKQEDQINKLIAQISYKYYEELKYFTNPELQLGLILLMSGMSTYQKNKMLNILLEKCKTEEEKENVRKTFG
ncbi:MAG TPA: hypothetical protein VLR54_04975, partial [Methanobacteriaceae archaeon]|nr:hypothetical protein [Methanobacteriaceae archaeon]